MCIASQITNEFENLFDKIEDEFNRLKKEMSEIDKLEQDILHIIENAGYSASEGYKLCKSLTNIRQARRKIKNEFEPIQILRQSIVDYKIKNKLINKGGKKAEEAYKKLSKLSKYKIYSNKVLNSNENIFDQVQYIIHTIN